MSRVSRPPGFDMTYRPKKATFGPPLVKRLPATLYFAAACLIVIAVVAAPHMPADSWLYRFIVLADYRRTVSAQAFSILIFTSATAAILRQQLSGVVVHADGIESREVVSLGLPRIRRYAWAQIDRVRIPPASRAQHKQRADEVSGSNAAGKTTKIGLDLWDGSKAILPDVARAADLSVTIERVALARAIPIEGGSGLLDELGNPFGEDGSD
jgi:hypothetical protein